MRRWDRTAAAAVVASVLVAGSSVAGVNVATAATQPGPSAAAPGAVSETSLGRVHPQVAGCPAILFVAARGSGEYGPGSVGWPRGRSKTDPYGLGGALESVRVRLVARLGSLVSTVSVPYPAGRVQTILHDPARYFAGIATGVTATESVLKHEELRAGCSGQRIVLAGYSQGAMVMHRVLHDLTRFPSVKARVDATVLVADGDQVPRDAQARYGSAALTTDGVAQALRTVSHASNVRFPAAKVPRVLSVCDRGDVVCDFSQTFGVGIAGAVKVLSPVGYVALMTRDSVVAARGILIHLHYAWRPETLAAADRAAALALASLSTTRLVLSPATSAGEPAPAWTVDYSWADPSNPIDCSYPEASLSSLSANVYYCSPSAALADTCWPVTGSAAMLCLADPWTRTLEFQWATSGVLPVAATTDPVPLGLELADGDHCRLRDGGAWGNPAPHPDWVGFYTCDKDIAIWGPPTSDGFATTGRLWSVWVGGDTGALRRVPVLRTIYVATAP